MFPRTNSCGSIRLLDTALGGFIRFRHMEDTTAAATVATIAAVAVEDTICVSLVSYGVARKGMDIKVQRDGVLARTAQFDQMVPLPPTGGSWHT